MSSYVQTIVISEEMIAVLCDADINHEYLEMLAQFNIILNNSKNHELSDCKSMH